MLENTSMPQLKLLGLSLLLLSFIAGCGDSSGLKAYPTTGQFIYQGEPLQDADVVFSLAGEEGQPSTILGLAKTDADGKFSIRTQVGPDKTLEGAVAGKHKVTVAKYIPPDNMTEEEYQKMMAEEVALMEEKGYLEADEYTPPKIPALPQKYQHPDYSQLSATVEEGGENHFVFELE